MLPCDCPGMLNFGGIVVVFTGDWRQTLPVVKRENEVQISQAFDGTAPCWAHVRKLKLTRNMLEAAQDGHGESSETTEFPSDMIVQT
jgi:hypothetical protein